MNREIKLRGKTQEGKWITGSETFIRDGDGVWLSDGCDVVKVIEDTVGQFTGLCDANGREIYEGDVVKWHDKYPQKVISWFICQFDAGDAKSSMSLLSLKYKCPLEVIGNIHDNPELLKGGEK